MNDHHSENDEESSNWVDLESTNENASLPLGAVPYILLGIVALFIVCIRLYIVSSNASH